MIFGLRHFRPYSLGRKFECRVDHMALTYYSKTVEPVGQQARYLDFIADFDFVLKYRPGARHANCDAHSRLRPCEVNSGERFRQCNKRVYPAYKRAFSGAENVVVPTAAPDLVSCRIVEGGMDNNGPLDDSTLRLDYGMECTLGHKQGEAGGTGSEAVGLFSSALHLWPSLGHRGLQRQLSRQETT